MGTKTLCRFGRPLKWMRSIGGLLRPSSNVEFLMCRIIIIIMIMIIISNNNGGRFILRILQGSAL